MHRRGRSRGHGTRLGFHEDDVEIEVAAVYERLELVLPERLGLALERQLDQGGDVAELLGPLGRGS